jgi:hypothetical protein
LLSAWESGADQALTEKIIRLLELAFPDSGIPDIRKLSIGQRDALLLELRESLFGPRLLNRAVCPHCSTPLEWETRVEDLKLQPAFPLHSYREFQLDHDGYRVHFRLPNSLDLSLFDEDSTPVREPKGLLYHCILDIQKDRSDYPVRDLPETLIESLDLRMAEEDPQADIRMMLICASCAWKWEVHFDIASYLWTEIDGWARRILMDVCTIASTLGWSERDILNLSPRRRQFYLEMLRS